MLCNYSKVKKKNTHFMLQFSEVCIATTQSVPPGQCSVPKLQGKPKATSLHLRWGKFSFSCYMTGCCLVTYKLCVSKGRTKRFLLLLIKIQYQVWTLNLSGILFFFSLSFICCFIKMACTRYFMNEGLVCVLIDDWYKEQLFKRLYE